MDCTPNKCDELTEKVLSTMRADGYSGSLVDGKLQYAYHKLVRYCIENNDGIYTSETGKQFLESIKKGNLKEGTLHYYCNGIFRMDKALEGDLHCRLIPSNTKAYASSCFDSLLFTYEEQLTESNKTKKDVRRRIHIVARFLHHCETEGYNEISSLDPNIIYSGFEAAGCKEDFQIGIRHFLRYIYRNKLISVDLSPFVPAVKRHKPVPTVYSAEEVNIILTSIDKNSPNGKRNFAILLLAARTGLRSSDIVDLTFENINKDAGVISLIQRKTRVSIELPLLDEVRCAIDDYVDNERPNTDLSNIFVSKNNPFVHTVTSSCIYNIVSRVIDKSGVNVAGRKKGAHALRSSLASQLLEEGNNYPTIQKILGQKDPESAKHYVRIDLKRLKSCALPVQGLSIGVKKLITEAYNE